ncbi:MAG: DUF4175 domain-containing protein [Neomegalonema sp.]|nr:DUF4175 domain-containing protein [Neomegalonema sp.]
MNSDTQNAKAETRQSPRQERRQDRRRRQVERRLLWRTDMAQLYMAADNAILALWPLLIVFVVFLAMSSAGVWTRVGSEVRLGLLILLGGAMLAALIRAGRKLRWPRKIEARAHLDEGRPSRPVASFDEELALGHGDKSADALWRAHQLRITEEADKVRAPGPELTVGGQQDPWAARFFAFLALGGAVLLSPGGGRMADAFAPFGAEAATRAPVDAVEVWATPPDYTGVPPIYFKGADARRGVARLPIGSKIFITAYLESGAPELKLTPSLKKSPLVEKETGSYAAELTADRSRRIVLTARPSDALPAVDLKIEPIDDRAPRIVMVKPPARSEDGRLGVSYAAADDYGVEKAWIEMRLDAEAAKRFGLPADDASVERIDIAAPSRTRAGLIKGSALDLANPTVAEVDVGDHRWSGLPVIITVHVADALGQTAVSAPSKLMLPDLMFSEALAKAIIEQRRNMVWATKTAPRAVRILHAAIARPQEYFAGSAIYLLIQSALRDLAAAAVEDKLPEAKDKALEKLMRAAKRLEDQGRDNPPGRLERAQRRLREALERTDITEKEIARLMAELRAAIKDYIAFLQKLSRTNPELAEKLSKQFSKGGKSMGRSQLEKMLKALEDAARGGQRDQARKMLGALEDLMKSLRPGGKSQGSRDGFGDPQAGKDGEGKKDGDVGRGMRDMIEKQQRLAEEGFDEYMRRRREEGSSGNQGNRSEGDRSRRPDGKRSDRSGPSGDALAKRQRELREGLRSLRGKIDEALPRDSEDRESAARRRRAERALDRAEEGMRRAEERLAEKDERGAAREQTDVIENLRDGFREFDRRLAEKERREKEGDPERRRADEERRDQERRRDSRRSTAEQTDPLGRKRRDTGRGPTSTEKLKGRIEGYPTAREVLDELRKRSGDRSRPEQELEYFKRLLDDFFR